MPLPPRGAFDPVNEQRQLFGAQAQAFAFAGRPAKSAFLQALEARNRLTPETTLFINKALAFGGHPHAEPVFPRVPLVHGFAPPGASGPRAESSTELLERFGVPAESCG